VNLRQSYDELRKNLGRSYEELRKILSFENRAPVAYPADRQHLRIETCQKHDLEWSG